MSALGDDVGIPRCLAALLFEFNDEQTHSARYVRTWPPESTDAPITASHWDNEMTNFYKRHGEGDIRLGYDRVTEDGKIDPKEFVFFEPEDPASAINPQSYVDTAMLGTKYEKLVAELDQDGKLSLAKSFAYLIRKARTMRYRSVQRMLAGLKAYHWSVFFSQGQRASPLEEGSGGPESVSAESVQSVQSLDSAGGLHSQSHSRSQSASGDSEMAGTSDDDEGDGDGRDDSGEGQGRKAEKVNLADLHLPMATVVEACLEMEIWLSRQVTAESDACRAAQLRESLDPELTKLMDEQLHLVQRELLLRAVDIFDYPDWYSKLSEAYLTLCGLGDGGGGGDGEGGGDGGGARFLLPPLGFSMEELSGPFPRPVPHLGLEDECRQSLYRRIVSQAVDSYFYNDWNARMELWAFQKSPVLERKSRRCMQFVASKPMGDLTDTRVPGVVYIATEKGVKLIAIKRKTLKRALKQSR